MAHEPLKAVAKIQSSMRVCPTEHFIKAAAVRAAVRVPFLARFFGLRESLPPGTGRKSWTKRLKTVHLVRFCANGFSILIEGRSGQD